MEIKKPPVRPEVDLKRCTGCGRCVAACGERKVTLQTVGNRKHAELLDCRECPPCSRCQEECPVGAISL